MSKSKEYPDSNLNADFCKVFNELADYEKNVTKNIHKYNAYRNASSTLASHPKRINNGKEAKTLKGIGDKIALKIDEILETGKLQKLESIRSDENSQAITELTKVSGIGPAKASDLVSSGICSISDLQNNKKKLNTHQLIGLKHFSDFLQKIPRKEITEIEQKLMEIAKMVDPDIQITICGSYRRGKEVSGDIDALITHPQYTSNNQKNSQLLKKLVETLKNENLVTDTLSHGVTKFMGVCKLDEKKLFRRLDIRLLPCDQYSCGLLYFTGSDQFNKAMRGHALEQGFTLNEYALRVVGSTGVPGEAVPVSCEEDVFDYINYKYKKPYERDI